MCPRPRFQNLTEEKRVAIISAAGENFGKYGYAGASINAILTDAGLSKGAFYYYFDDKADLFCTVIEWVWGEIFGDEGFDPNTLNQDTFWVDLVAVTDQSMSFTLEHPWVINLGTQFQQPPDDPAVLARLTPIFMELMSMQTGMIERGQTLGVIRSDIDTDLMIALMNAVDQAKQQWVLSRSDSMTPKELKAYGRLGIDLNRRILAPADSSDAVVKAIFDD